MATELEFCSEICSGSLREPATETAPGVSSGSPSPTPPSALPGATTFPAPGSELVNSVDLLANPKRSNTFEGVNTRVARMTPEEMTALFKELRTRNDHPQQGLIEGILTMHLIGRDPASMIEIKLAYPNLPVLGRTYEQWGQSDPEGALAHIEEMKNETWYRQGMSAIFAGMGRADPERALAALNGISDIESRHYGSLFAAWTTRSPETATAAVDRVPSSHRATALRSIANRLPEVDPDAARSWITDLSPEDARQARPYYQARMRQLELPLEEQP